MENNNSQFADTVQHIYDYFNARIELLKLQATEKASHLYANFLSVLILFILGLIVLFFLSTAAAILLGQQMGNMTYGFGIVALFYLLVFMVFMIFRKKLVIQPMMDFSIRNILNSDNEQE